MAERALTSRQLSWVDHFMACGDAARAAELADYSGASRHSLAVAGSRNLANPKIRAELRRRGATLPGDSDGNDAEEFPEDPDEAIAALARNGSVHSNTRLRALELLSRQKRADAKGDDADTRTRKLLAKVNEAHKGMRARERETGCCHACDQPLPERR